MPALSAAALPPIRPSETRRHRRPSRGELERRWALVRAHMWSRGLDVMIASATENDLGGYVRWLTDGTVAYRKIVAFFADDLMTLVEHGGHGMARDLDGYEPDRPGVGQVLTVSEFPSVFFTQRYELEALAPVLRARGCRRIGLLNPGAMPNAFVAGLHEALANAVFTDESEAVDWMKAIKSDEEIALIREGAEVQDAVFARVLAEARPGMTDAEICAIARAEARRRHGEYGVIMAGSAPPGTPANFFPEERQARTTVAGDQVSLLIENGAPGGYVLELGRHLVFGDASDALIEAVEQAKEAQAYTLSLLKPGTPFRDVFLAFNDYMQGRGLPPERRLYAHGQGLDLIERPLVRDDETMSVAPGMCLTIHPGIQTASLFGFICDNYLIGADGPGACLHTTEKRVFEL